MTTDQPTVSVRRPGRLATALRALLTPTAAPAQWPADVVARFTTVGASAVDLHTHRFTTRYTPQGRPYVGDAREVDGYLWQCHGCAVTGSYGHYRDPYLPDEREQAHQDANDHAATCRAMPRPTA
ncbi:hypothetical protein [Kitasatospora sp. NPDC088351]|uniref:hypothetical protein n=1 Tax=Kitasatospora sp. NPDC088351 TaxID=3155180 RepID=UPI003438B7E7